MTNTWKKFLIYIYKKLIVSVKLIDKGSSLNTVAMANLHVFSKLEIATTAGKFEFTFKEDRRRKRRDDEMFSLTTFLVEVHMPDHANDILKKTETRILSVVKLIIFKPNYPILAELLLDLYLDEFIAHFSNKKK